MSNNIECRLYIEGHRIPFNYISINASVNTGSTATINIAPDEHVKNLFPRSHILILFLDADKVWRVLWDGELRGWGTTKSAGGINMQITAADYSNSLSFITRYILDGNGFAPNTTINALFQTGENISFQPAGAGNFVELIQGFFQGESSADFSVLMVKLLDEIWNDIPYFREAIRSNGLTRRIVGLPDEEIQRILTNNITSRYMEGIIQNQFIGNISFDQVLNYFLQVAGYIRCPMISPSSVDGIPPVMILKPDAHFSVPPCCNCFFPGMYTSCSGLSVDYFSEPTRLMLQTEVSPGANDTNIARMYFFNESHNLQSINENPSNVELVKGLVSGRELDRGILPIVRQVSFERAMLIRGESTDERSIQDSMTAYSWYEFINEKYGRRSFTVTGGFNPYAVVGFPGVVFDRQQTLFGSVQSISHNISAEGSATTVVSFSHGTPASLSDDNDLQSPPIPDWISDKYKPEKANETYAALFGNNSVEGSHAAMGGEDALRAEGVEQLSRRYSFAQGKQFNISQMAATVFPIPRTGIDSLAGLMRAAGSAEGSSLWEAHSGNQGDFEERYTRRNIISARAYLGFMGIDADNIGNVFGEGSDLYSHPSAVSFTSDGYDVTERDGRKYEAARRLQQSLERSTGRLGG